MPNMKPEVEDPLDTAARGEDSADLAASGEAAKHGKVTGIIIPPPDVRAVVDKTAQFVAKNGKSFEARIRMSAQGNSTKFDFMRAHDVFYPYYEHKIREYEEGTAEEAERKRREAEAAAQAAKEAAEKEKREREAKAQRETLERSRQVVTPIERAAKSIPKARPPPLSFVLPELATLTPLDGDVMKLCAQFTALGGRQFLAELTQREERNPQFDFLRPTHMLFSYFTALVDAYVKLLNQSEVVKLELERNMEPDSVIERAVWRWHHERASEAATQAKAEEEAAERQAFAAIDWHDFALVETIDFGKGELLDAAPAAAPASTTAPDAAAAEDGDMEMEDDEDMEMDMSDDEDAGDGADEEGLKVVTDYQAGGTATTAAAPRLVVDPVSGKTVPIDQVAEHLRIQLIDPKYQTQSQVAQARQAETNFASGVSIADNLRRFSSRRGDIFGSTEEEELALLKEARDAKKKDQDRQEATWEEAEGESAPTPAPPAPMPSATTPAVPTAPTPPVSAMPPPAVLPIPQPAPVPAAVPGAPSAPAPPPPAVEKRPAEDEAPPSPPSPKRARLTSVEDFLREHPDPYEVNVLVSENAAWNLQENAHRIEVTAQTTVKALREQLASLTGMSGNKFQLKGGAAGKFLRDEESLAVANVAPGSAVTFVIKGRGGRR